MGKSIQPDDQSPSKRKAFEKRAPKSADASAIAPLESLLSLPPHEWPVEGFEDEHALEILEDFYNLLLTNCTDDDDDVDTRTVLELLASMTGVFLADYAEFYGEEKTLGVLRTFISLALSAYSERQAQKAD